MTIDQELEEIRERLKNKEHREAFVSASVDQTIPFQVKAMRLAKHRNWTQEDLALRAGMKQERISTCENPNYGNFSLRTLKQLAAAFDVALIVRFAPFSELVEWEVNMSSSSLEVPSFDDEPYFKEGATEGDGLSSLLIDEYTSKNRRQYLGGPSAIERVMEWKQEEKEEAAALAQGGKHASSTRTFG